jgi:hypothetical protein
VRNPGKARPARILGVAVVCAAALLTPVVPPAGAADHDSGNLYPAAPDPSRFYDRPARLAHRDLGEVVRSRPIQLPDSAGFPAGTQAWQLLYRSTNFRGGPMPVVTTVLRPSSGRPAGLVSFQEAEDASYWACAPSHFLRAADNPEGAPSTDTESISQLLQHGFAVSVPDYEGPQSMFGARRQPGYAILDGLRAAIAFPDLGIGRRTPLAMWGYSGGSMASGWAAEVQPRYAPELHLRGTALGGFLTRILSGFKAVNSGPAAGFIPGLSPSLFRSNTRLGRAFDRHLNPEGRAALGRGATQCLNDNLTEFAGVDMSSYLDIPWEDFVQLKNVRDFRPHNLGRGTPGSPLYVYHAVNDELVYISHTDHAVQRYCSRGTPVEYHRVQVGEHLSLQASAIPAAVAWLTDRLASSGPAKGCTTVTEPAP